MNIWNDGLADGCIDVDDPVEIAPGVFELYGDLTTQEIEAAKEIWNRIVDIFEEFTRLARAALHADAARAKELLPAYACEYAIGNSVEMLPLPALQHILTHTRVGARVMGIT